MFKRIKKSSLLAMLVIIGIFTTSLVMARINNNTGSGGSGSGTVGTGTTGQVPYYASGGTTLTATSSLFINTDGSVTISNVVIEAVASSTIVRAGDGSAATPSYSFTGDTDRGLYLDSSGGGLGYANAGTRDWFITGNAISSNDTAGGGLLDETASAINPTVLPRRSNTSMGIGSNAIDQLSLIASSTELLRLIGPSVDTATTTAGRVQLPNDVFLTGADSASSFVNMFKVNSNSQIEVGGELTNLGGFKFEEDSGAVTHTYMNVSSDAVDGTEESFSFTIDGVSPLKVYTESDGAGGVDTSRVDVDGILTSTGDVGIGTTSPKSSLHVNGGTGSLAEGLAFGDGDTGFYELSDDTLALQIGGGTNRIYIDSASMRDADNNSWALLNESPSATNPVMSFQADTNTGIGRAGDDILSLIAGANEILRLTDTAATSTATFSTDNANVGACLKYEDNDGAGFTYCSFLDGVQTCSTTSCE